jgi:hypothetical protein
MTKFRIKGLKVGFGVTIPFKNTIGTRKYYFEPDVEIVGDESLDKEQFEATLAKLYEELHEMVKEQVKSRAKQDRPNE